MARGDDTLGRPKVLTALQAQRHPGTPEGVDRTPDSGPQSVIMNWFLAKKVFVYSVGYTEVPGRFVSNSLQPYKVTFTYINSYNHVINNFQRQNLLHYPIGNPSDYSPARHPIKIQSTIVSRLFRSEMKIGNYFLK